MTSKKKKPKQLPQYDGPSRKEVLTFSLDKVLSELKRLSVEPQRTIEDLYIFDDLEPLVIEERGDIAPASKPQPWTPEHIKVLEGRRDAFYLTCLRGQLFSAYLDQWAAALSDADAWHIMEDYEGVKAAVSERRYTSREELRARVCAVIYHQEVQNCEGQ